MSHQLERRTEQTGFALSDTAYQITAGLYNAIALTNEPDSYRETTYFYSRHIDMAGAVNNLLDMTSDQERRDIFLAVSDLAAQSDEVGRLFPEELSKPATKAYGELTTSLLWTFMRIKEHQGRLPARFAVLRSGRNIPIQEVTLEGALQTAHELHGAVEKIVAVASDDTAPITRVNSTGAYGMYRLGRNRDVFATIRLLKRTSYDPAIEYGNAMGAEASISFSIDAGKDKPSAFRSDQVSPFSIRIDNEGDALSLDVGSILGAEGTLGKRVAELITIGDQEREESVETYGGIKTTGLNHSKGYFPPELAEPDTFAQIAARMAAALENRRQSIQAVRLRHLPLPVKTTAV